MFAQSATLSILAPKRLWTQLAVLINSIANTELNKTLALLANRFNLFLKGRFFKAPF